MWYKLALLGAACIVLVLGWLIFGKADAGLYGLIVGAIAVMLPQPVKKP